MSLRKAVIVVVVAAALGCGGYYTRQNQSGGSDALPLPEEKPTDFWNVGVVSFRNEGGQSTPYLTFDTGPEATGAIRLRFDAMSVCAAANGAAPCMALSATLDQPYGGKQVIVEGRRQDDGSVLIRKIQRVEEGGMVLPMDPGRVFISWPEAVRLIEQCNVTMVMQTHSLDINLRLKDGREVTSVEPTIDGVFQVTQRANCPNVIIATE
jgi:hypothetical protein